MEITFNMYITLAVAVIVLMAGKAVKQKVGFLRKFCIPESVVGGLLFSLVTLILHLTGLATITFDSTLSDLFRVIFFTTVGFMANFKTIREGGKTLILFLVSLAILIVCQNLIAVGIASLIGISPLAGLCTGSIPMVGGHGTAGAFGPLLESMGISGATTLATAAATFGLIAGSLMGGPLAEGLIKKYDLKPGEDDRKFASEKSSGHQKEEFKNISVALAEVFIAAGVGNVLYQLISKTGITFPDYMGAMLVGAIIRNYAEISGKFDVHMYELGVIGEYTLRLFIAIAMISLKLWQLAELALPMVLLLTGQTVFMYLFARFFLFRFLGGNYDSAVIVSGACGFGMGATPNAMANINAVCDRHGVSRKAFFLVPIVGSLFTDFMNTFLITVFINIFS